MRQGIDSLRHERPAADERAAEIVVEQPDAIGRCSRYGGTHETAAGAASGSEVLANNRENFVECLDPLVGEVLADEFKLLLVEQSRLHDDREFAADQRRDLDVDEL